MKIWRKKIVLIIKIHTSHTKHTALGLFVCSNHAPFKLQWKVIFTKKCSSWFWHTSDLEVSSSSSNLLDPKQGYNHAKFERLPLNSVHQETNIKVSVNSENALECAQEWKIVAYSLSTLTYLTILQSLNLIGYQHKYFQLEPFDIALTFKCVQGHWKWYELVELNE